jgi:transposase-like protein
MEYSHRIKESVLRKVLPPENRSVREVARETGITEKTIYNWKRTAGDVNVSKKAGSPKRLNRLEKFNLLLEAKGHNEETIGKWLRAKGLDSRHIELWEKEFQDTMNKDSDVQKENKQLKKEKKELQKELARKEKALSETAALLALKKKADSIWGDGEDD